MTRSQTLDRPKAACSGFAQGDELVSAPEYVSMIGALLPIALCGRSSFSYPRQSASFSAASAGGRSQCRFRHSGRCRPVLDACAQPDRQNSAGPVAQWSEQGAHNALVGGSSPSGPTNPRSRHNEINDIVNGLASGSKQLANWAERANLTLPPSACLFGRTMLADIALSPQSFRCHSGFSAPDGDPAIENGCQEQGEDGGESQSANDHPANGDARLGTRTGGQDKG